MAAFSSYEVKIADNTSGTSGRTILTTIADSSSIVDNFLYEVWELNSEFKVGMRDDDVKVVEVVGVTVECCADDCGGSISSINTNNKIATLQLCYGVSGILIQLLHLKKIPSSLRTFFADDKNFAFVRVGIRDAFAKLERDYGLNCEYVIELGTMASRICRKSQFFDSNLEELAREIAGINIEKPTIPSLSHWDARDLRNEQIDYAITKAYASYTIGNKLMRRDIKK